MLDRRVVVRVRGLAPGRRRQTLHRVDAGHGNIVDAWRTPGAPDWPDREAWLQLRAADRLEAAEPPRDVVVRGGELALELELPMPGVALVSLTPA